MLSCADALPHPFRGKHHGPLVPLCVVRDWQLEVTAASAVTTEVIADQSCASSDVSPDTTGVHGHSRSCVERPGGYGHPGGFELKGTVELSGVFDGDDIGVELVFGCSQKTDEGQCIGAEPWKMPKVSGASNTFSYY